MKHVRPLTRLPRAAQTLDFEAIASLVADVLSVLASAVLAKEEYEYTTDSEDE